MSEETSALVFQGGCQQARGSIKVHVFLREWHLSSDPHLRMNELSRVFTARRAQAAPVPGQSKSSALGCQLCLVPCGKCLYGKMHGPEEYHQLLLFPHNILCHLSESRVAEHIILITYTLNSIQTRRGCR